MKDLACTFLATFTLLINTPTLMKSTFKSVFYFSLALLTAFTFLQCEEKPEDVAPPCCADDANITGRITRKQAQDKINLYVANQYNYINTGLNTTYGQPGDNKIVDNREVWFDLENLKEYICYVEEESEKKGYKDLGLRVYLGAIPDEKDVPHTTVLFWPTHRNKTNTESGNRAANSDEEENDSNKNENSDGIDGLNYGTSGRPPKVLGGK